MIRFENVTKEFDVDGTLVKAVDHVSFEIKKGSICGIIGFSGAGKSTLVRCINLLERPTEGKVFLEDTELTALNEKELRRKRTKIGMIFQQFNLFASRTVEQNIAYPLKHSGKSKGDIKKKVNDLLDLVGLTDKAEAYPSQLSGGQKQRVAIARALANDPDVLLSDESTSALDPQTTTSILKLLQEVNRRLNITIVVITHEMQVVKEICNHVIVMEEGKVVEEGDVFQIFSKPTASITQEFVDHTGNLSKINQLIEDKVPLVQLKPGECILKFRYLERNASEALVSRLSRQFNLDINIIFGNIELIGEHPIGGLVSIVRGRPEDIEAGIEYLKNKNVGVEVIIDERNT